MKKDRYKGRLIGVHCSIAGGVANAPKTGAELGCTAIQLFTSSNQQWRTRPISDDDAEAFAQEMKAGGIRVAIAHASYLINLAAPDRTTYARSLRGMREEIERAAMLSLPFVVVHPGAHKDRGLDWGIARIIDSIDRILDETKALSTKIALETTAGQGTSIGSRFEELAAIIDGVADSSRVVVCLDTAHVFAAGYELRTKKGWNETWRQFRSTVGMKKLAALHLNDSMFDLGLHRDRHAHIGEGKIGLSGFRLLMNDPALAPLPMILETPKAENPTAHDSKNLRTLLGLIQKKK